MNETANSERRPAVSLLVPICNVERYLQQCLSSAVNQTLSNIEIVCINDGSTDGSLEIIERFASQDSRVKVIDKPNSGYGDSMNRGLEICTGEYIGILESDDFLELDALEMLYEAAKEHRADVAKADFYLYWSVPEERDERFGWVDAEAAGSVSPLEYPEVFFRKPSIWSAIYRMDFLNENGIRFLPTPGASYQDTSFNFKVWASADVAVLIDAPIIHYRQDNEKSSVNSAGKVFCVCDEYGEIDRFADSFEGHRGRLLSIVARMRYDAYVWNYDRLTDELKPGFLARMSEDFRREDDCNVEALIFLDDGKRELRELAKSHPELFALKHNPGPSHGKLETLKSYYRAGGVKAVAGVCREKLLG